MEDDLLILWARPKSTPTDRYSETLEDIDTKLDETKPRWGHTSADHIKIGGNQPDGASANG
jgi:hypothetical protein